MRHPPVFLVLALAACAESPVAIQDPSVPPGIQAAPPSSCNAFAPLSVTFRDQAGDALRSDGGGAYVEGANGVEAHVNGPTGNLSIWTTASARFVVANHSGGSVNIDRVYTNTHSNQCGLRLSTLPASSTAVLEAEERSDGTGQTVSVVRYGKSCTGSLSGPLVSVTKVDATTIVIAGSSGVYCTKNKNKFVQTGTVGSFEMTLVAQ